MSSDRAWVYGNRKEVYQAMGDHDAALRDAQKALELAPDDMSTLRSTADMHIVAQQWEQAIECYDELIKLEPNNVSHFTKRAQCELLLRGLDVYRARCREAIERFITPEASIQDKRVVAAMCTEVAGAVDDTGTIVELAREIVAANPPPALWNEKILAHALLRDGQIDEALTMWREIESDDSDKNRAGTLFTLAIANHLSGKPDIAKKWLEIGDLWLAEHSGTLRFPLLVQIRQQEAHEALGIPMPTVEQDRAPKTITTEATAAPSSPALLPHKAGGEGSQGQ